MRNIAILLATLNGGKYIKAQLESLKQQTMQNFVCYIHDDGSCDNTMELVRQFQQENPEQFVIVEGAPTGHAKSNFMYLLGHVLGQYEYYMFCDQDDVWLPDKIEVVYNRILREEGHEPCLVFSDMKVVNEQLQEIAPSFSEFSHICVEDAVFPNTMLRGYGAGCTMILNEALAKLSYVPDTSKLLMHDWWIVLIASLSGKIYYEDRPLSLYRQHQENVMGAQKRSEWIHFTEIVKRVVTLQQYKVTRKGLYESIYQVAALKQVPGLYEQHKELIDGANRINKMSKLERCRYILKYGIYQNSYSRYWSCVCI